MMRKIVCCLLVTIIPASLSAQDTGGAIISGKGALWLNGAAVPGSSPVVSGDVILTKAQTAANITMPGSTIAIQSDSALKFEDKQLFLDHGTINVGTSRQMSVLAVDVVITPIGTAWTEFLVSTLDGNLQVQARKSSVSVTCGTEAQTLSEGQQLTRDHSGHCTREGAGAFPPATGLITGNHLLWAGIAAGGGALLCVILCGASNPPASPSKP